MKVRTKYKNIILKQSFFGTPQSVPAREQGQRVEACCAERRKINVEFKSFVRERSGKRK